MRLFFALWPPREAADALHAWALEVRRATGGRALGAESIHLTLAFLGEIEERRVAELSGLSAGGERHSLPIEQARHWGRNRIVWVGPRKTPTALRSLVLSLDLELKDRSFRTESRAFSAHVTLIRNARQGTILPPLPALDWQVEEFVLVRSRLAAQAPSYEVVGRYPLK